MVTIFKIFLNINNLPVNQVFQMSELEKVIKEIQDFDGPFCVTDMAKKIDKNKMFLSGMLNALKALGFLNKRNLGKTHLYSVKSPEKLNQLL